MKPSDEPYATTFIKYRRRADRCKWCWRERPRNGLGLCRPCNDVRKELALFEKRAGESKDYVTDWRLRVAREMKQDCQFWGMLVKHILEGPVSGLKLESEFHLLWKRITPREKMHSGSANMFDWTFTTEQKQVLAYLLWELFSAEASLNRRNRAMGRVAAA